MVSSAPSATTIMNGNPSHVFVITFAENALAHDENHDTSDRPTAWSSELIAPYSPLPTSHLRVKASASSTPIVTWSATFAIVHSTVTPRMNQKFCGSSRPRPPPDRISTKFDSPTNVHVP